MRYVDDVRNLQPSRPTVFVNVASPDAATLACVAVLFQDICAHFLADGTRNDRHPVDIFKHILAGFQIGTVEMRSYLVAQFFPKFTNPASPGIGAVAYRFAKGSVVEHLAHMLKKVGLSPS